MVEADPLVLHDPYGGDSAREGRVHRVLLLRAQDRRRADLVRNRHQPYEGGEDCADEREGPPRRLNRLTRFPQVRRLGPDRPGNEPHQLDQHQEDAQQLEGNVIDEQSNAEEHRQPIEPGGVGKKDQPRALRWPPTKPRGRCFCRTRATR